MGRRPNTLCSLTGQELETGELAAGTMVRGVASGCHVLISNASEEYVNEVGPKRATEVTWRLLLHDMGEGIMPCSNPECDRCDELDEGGD